MTSMRVQDRILLTATELTLVESSEPSRIKEYTSGQLSDRIARARRFWDKYCELARQQRQITKQSPQYGRRQPSSNVRTERKAQVFAGALKRFEKRLEQLKREEHRLSRRQATPVPTSLRHAGAQRETIRKKKQQGRSSNEAALVSGITRQFRKSKMRAILGHISARGKRRQAKRDARR